MKKLASSFFCLFLWGCVDTITNHGWVGDKSLFSTLRVGSTSRKATLQHLGKSTFMSSFDKNIVFYVSAQMAQGVSFLRPRVLRYGAQELVFDQKGMLSSYHVVGVDDCLAFSPTLRETPIKKRDRSLFLRAMGNFGRFSS